MRKAPNESVIALLHLLLYGKQVSPSSSVVLLCRLRLLRRRRAVLAALAFLLRRAARAHLLVRRRRGSLADERRFYLRPWRAPQHRPHAHSTVEEEPRSYRQRRFQAGKKRRRDQASETSEKN